jgi:hypothetical protein
MKIRQDFVTNSSSSSYIICFARIADEEKANKIIKKHNLEVFDVEGVSEEKSWTGDLGADWCGAIIYGVDEILAAHPNDKYIIITDSNDACYDEDSYEPIYDYNFSMNDAIDDITEENGFANIECAEGEGRDG